MLLVLRILETDSETELLCGKFVGDTHQGMQKARVMLRGAWELQSSSELSPNWSKKAGPCYPSITEGESLGGGSLTG